jgi:SAM-dependent methyltransferase
MASRHQIKEAVRILQEACKENFDMFKNELKQDLDSLERYIKHSDQAYQAINSDMGKSLAMGFNDKFFEIMQVTHHQNVSNFIDTWILKQSDWKYPVVYLCPTTLMYTEHGVKTNLAYILSNRFNRNKIDSYLNTKNISNSKQYRHKNLEIHGDIPDMDVPYGQVGSIVCLEYLPYLSLEQIRNLLKSFFHMLKPGGSAFIHFSDADQQSEWNSVVQKKRTYLTESLLKQIAVKFDFECEFFHIEDFYSFASIRKPGKLDSIKAGPTKMEKIGD